MLSLLCSILAFADMVLQKLSALRDFILARLMFVRLFLYCSFIVAMTLEGVFFIRTV